MTGRQSIGFPADRRGQTVLLAGVVVALALVAMLVAFLQLGYHADVATAAPGERAVTDGQSFLQRATHDAARDVRGDYSWDQREAAVTAFRDRLRPRIETLERSGVESGVAFDATVDRALARERASSVCPCDPARQFGRCRADRGVVVQERGGRTLVLAVAFELDVVTADSETTVAFAANSTE